MFETSFYLNSKQWCIQLDPSLHERQDRDSTNDTREKVTYNENKITKTFDFNEVYIFLGVSIQGFRSYNINRFHLLPFIFTIHNYSES